MNKLLIIIIVTLAVVGAGAIGFMLLQALPSNELPPTTANQLTQPGGSNTQTTYPSNVTSSPNTPTQSSVSIRGAAGESIQIKDLSKDPDLVKDTYNQGVYYLGYHYVMDENSTSTVSINPPYVIEFIPPAYFNITILQEPIGDVRKQLESYMMQHLGISQDQMCKLNYDVTVPHWVSEIYTSINLKFSFCSGAVAL